MGAYAPDFVRRRCCFLLFPSQDLSGYPLNLIKWVYMLRNPDVLTINVQNPSKITAILNAFFLKIGCISAGLTDF